MIVGGVHDPYISLCFPILEHQLGIHIDLYAPLRHLIVQQLLDLFLCHTGQIALLGVPLSCQPVSIIQPALIEQPASRTQTHQQQEQQYQ